MDMQKIDDARRQSFARWKTRRWVWNHNYQLAIDAMTSAAEAWYARLLLDDDKVPEIDEFQSCHGRRARRRTRSSPQ